MRWLDVVQAPCRPADQSMIARRNATSSAPASSAVVTPRPSAQQPPTPSGYAIAKMTV
jgi:hypothetical protein